MYDNRRDLTIILIYIVAVVSLSGCEGFKQGRQASSEYSTMYTMKNWVIALEKYHKINNEYPSSNSMKELQKILTPFHDGKLPLRILDSWNEKYLINSTRDSYTISSKGDDKIGGHEFGGAISQDSYKHSITIKDGNFVQYRILRSKIVKEFEDEIQKIKSGSKVNSS